MSRISAFLSRIRKSRHRILLHEQLEDRSLLTAGALDPTFGMGGKVTTDFGFANGSAYNDDFAYPPATVIQSDGKILVAGSCGGDSDFAVARYNTDGSPDTSFGTEGRVIIDFGGASEWAAGIAALSSGKIVVSGTSNGGALGAYNFAVARLNGNGTLDTTFSGDGKQIIDFNSVGEFSESQSFSSAMTTQADGKIILTGDVLVDGNFQIALARFNADGSLDSTFGTAGEKIIDGFYDSWGIAVQMDERIVLAGTNIGPDADFGVIRLLSDGNLDSSFGTGGIQTVDFGGSDVSRQVVMQPDNKIVVGGTSEGDFAVARLNTNGSLDTSFDGDGKQTINFGDSDILFGLAMTPDSKIVIAGLVIFFTPTFDADFGVCRINTDGTLDDSFDGDGKQTVDFGTQDQAMGVAVQSDGKIVVAGVTYMGDTGYDFAVARLSGSTDDVAGIDIPAGISRSGSVLRFSGGDGTDVVNVSNGNLLINGTAYSLAGVTEVRIWGRGGNDQIDLSGLAVRAFVNGGNGNDVLTGGSSDDVIFGGGGDDTITGAAGNDFLIGGVGKDRLVGSAGNDILVAGDVDSTLDILALQAISQEWAASHSTSEAESIDSALDETLGDGNSDLLTGGAGADLFIINWDDKITDFQFGKPKTNKDGDVVIRDGLVVS